MRTHLLRLAWREQEHKLKTSCIYFIKNKCGEMMLNYLWAGMIVIGILFGAFNGKMPEITNAALDSSKEAVTLCITMMGVMSFWVGLMEIATKAGIIKAASRKIQPIVRILFPDIPRGHKANEHITTNMIANFLGLGWAATPAGLMAMKSLQEINPNRDKTIASRDMCTFLILNISHHHRKHHTHSRTDRCRHNPSTYNPSRVHTSILAAICDNINRYQL